MAAEQNNVRDIGIRQGLAKKDIFSAMLKSINTQIRDGEVTTDGVVIKFKENLIPLEIKEDKKKLITFSQLFINQLFGNITNYENVHTALSRFGKNNLLSESMFNKIEAKKDKWKEVFGDENYFELNNKDHPQKNFLIGKLLFNHLYTTFDNVVKDFVNSDIVKKYNTDITKNEKILNYKNSTNIGIKYFETRGEEYVQARIELKKIHQELNKELLNQLLPHISKLYEFFDLKNSREQSALFTYNVKKVMNYRENINGVNVFPLFCNVEKFISQNLDSKHFENKVKSTNLEKNTEDMQTDDWKKKYTVKENNLGFSVWEKKGTNRLLLRNDSPFGTEQAAIEFATSLNKNRTLGDRIKGEYICNFKTNFIDVDKAAYVQANNLRFFESGKSLDDESYKNFINVSTNSFEIFAKSLNISSLMIIPKQKILNSNELMQIKNELINNLEALQLTNKEDNNIIKKLKETEFKETKNFSKFLYDQFNLKLSHSKNQSQELNNFDQQLLNCFENILEKENVLGICAASRGFSNYAAHFETTNNAINITAKSIKQTTGVFAHEFGHFLDLFIGKNINKQINQKFELEPNNSELGIHLKWSKDQYLTSIKIKEESIQNPLYSSFKNFLDKTLKDNDGNKTEFYKNNIKADEGKTTPYFNTRVELFARAFESMVYWKMQNSDIIDTFLVKIQEQGGVYLNKEEFIALEKDFDNFILEYKKEFNIRDYVQGEKQKEYEYLNTSDSKQEKFISNKEQIEKKPNNKEVQYTLF